MNKDNVLRIAKEVWNINGVYSGHPIDEMLVFAARLEAEWMKNMEPVSVRDSLLAIASGKPLYLHPTPIPKGMVLVPEELVNMLIDNPNDLAYWMTQAQADAQGEK